MSFAEKQLTKFGWNKGDGLGKNKDGIKKSISVVKKNDTKGLGGKVDKWDFAWWDHVFNKSASNIQVNKDESGEVKVEKQGLSEVQIGRMGIISTSRPAGPVQTSTPSSATSTPSSATSTPSSATSTPSSMGSMTPRDEYNDDDDTVKPTQRSTSGPSWLLGFVKASASSAAVEQDKRNNQGSTTSADSFVPRSNNYDTLKVAEAEEYRDYSVKISDQELFEACEGRTPRKGARSEQPGKLGRVMTELLLDNTFENASSLEEKKNELKEKMEKKEKKGKKEKKEKKAKSSKKESKDKKDRKDRKDKKDKKDKKESKDKEKSSKKDKDTKKKARRESIKPLDTEKKSKDKSKKRSADEGEPRPAKKPKKSMDE